MKILFCILLLITQYVYGQDNHCKNIIVITIDGVRWQEIFLGADATLISKHLENYRENDSIQFWDSRLEVRRKKLMPFFWNYIVKNGQLWGNRNNGNKVNVKNKIRISYAGYNELFTGVVDNTIVTNKPLRNKNITILEQLNTHPQFKDSIAIFTSWQCFPYIFNEQRSHLAMSCGHHFNTTAVANSKGTAAPYPNEPTRNDAITYNLAKNYLLEKHPRVLHIGFGEADELAHHKNYTGYLQNLHSVDSMLADLWMHLQNDSIFNNNTVLLITTDHGRGNKIKNWHKHHTFVKGSGSSWLVTLGNCTKKEGEVTTTDVLYNWQIAPTMAALLGTNFLMEKKSLVSKLIE